jgi:hypothetical protein
VWRQDPVLQAPVVHIVGAEPDVSFIQVPKAMSQSLGLHGRFVYVLLRTTAVRFFSSSFLCVGYGVLVTVGPGQAVCVPL